MLYMGAYSLWWTNLERWESRQYNLNWVLLSADLALTHIWDAQSPVTLIPSCWIKLSIVDMYANPILKIMFATLLIIFVLQINKNNEQNIHCNIVFSVRKNTLQGSEQKSSIYLFEGEVLVCKPWNALTFWSLQFFICLHILFDT